MSRAMVDADRSLKGRDRDRERYADPVLRLSEEDIKRYEFLQRKRELSDLSLQVCLIFIFLTLFQTLKIIISTPINVSDKQKLEPFTNTHSDNRQSNARYLV